LVDVAIVRSNSILYDTRVLKISKSLNKRYSALALGWNREGLLKKIVNSYVIPLKLHNQRAPYGKYSLIVHYPLFWMWTLFHLVVTRPTIVYACDLDTVLPCYVYKILFRKKLIFDVFDRFGMANAPQNLRLRKVIDFIEEEFAKRSNVLVVTSERFRSSFKKKPKLCVLIWNCSEDHNMKKTKVHDTLLTLVYTGNITRQRGVEVITEAIKNLEGIKFIIAGRAVDEELLDEILKVPAVSYMGLLPPSDALELEGNSDALISLYDLSVPNYNLAMSNKTFEAMMFGIPVITNIALELIDEVGCGIKVEYNNLDQIKSAIISLRDNSELRKKLGANGRMAFEKKYNWNMMEQELYKINDNLLGKMIC
jgi:glycosyltransferase involved in cell wall biosynthesis